VKGGATREIQTTTIEEHTIVVKKRERERRDQLVFYSKEKVIEFCIHQSRSSLCVLSFEILVI
jgi:hypothetical protein